jgi:UrcA family protein
MKIVQNAAAAAIFALCALSPVQAGAQTRVPVSARIAIADLNLAHPAGRASLERRLNAAARRACGTIAPGVHDRSDTQRCYREMMADGRQQLARRSDTKMVELASVTRR